MKNMKRISLILLISLFSITLLIGCGNKEDKTDEPEDVVEDVDDNEEEEEVVKEEEEEKKEEKKEEVKLPEGPKSESIEDMNKRAKDIVKSNKDVLKEVKAEDGKDWHEIIFVLTDEFVENIDSMEQSEIDEIMKEIRKETFDSMGRSGVLNFKSDNKTITVLYEDSKGNEVIDKSVIDPD